MTGHTEVAIIGGGIAGLTLALALADRNCPVAVIDRPSDGAASRAAAGMLAPSLEGMPARVLIHALAARDFYPRFLAELEARTGMSVELNREGILELADHESALASLAQRALTGAQIVSPTELARLEPALAPHGGAVLHPLDGAVDNVALMSSLSNAVERSAGVTLIPERAIAVRMSPTPTVTLEGGASVRASRIVLAAGAWAACVKGLPRPLPLQPVRGQLLTLSGRPVRHVMYAPHTGYLVPRGSGLVVGATTEQTGFANETTSWGRQELLSVVARTLPALAGAAVEAHWAGLRPMTPDALPILGPDPDQAALWYACGFSRNGILLAPWAADQIAESLTQERLGASLDSFSIRRFDGQ